ncbi:superoxide dismutase [Cu-Zn]-like [Dendroctonus ponderosae]|uniref:superoxide dismutase n=1 Tax=Dendroctonus ponderosae TaxID=77166 RepID=J3JZH3_DENPD
MILTLTCLVLSTIYQVRSTEVVLREAVATIQGNGTNSVSGGVYFKETPSGSVEVSGTVTGLTSGLHGFHVHMYGDLTNGCLSTADHYNPHNVAHGGKNASTRHVGDLGNIDGGQTGTASIQIIDSVISLSGPHSIIGRAVVIHQDEDDLGLGGHEDSLTTGRAGPRIGCGVIGMLGDPISASHQVLPAMMTTLAMLLTAGRLLR